MTKIKKTLLAIVALALIAVLLGTAYLFLSSQEEAPEKEVEYGPFGEKMQNGRPYIVDEVSNSELDYIKIKNEHDAYTLIRKKSGAYKLEGLEDYTVNDQLLALLRVNALKLLAVDYIEDADLSDLSIYGIDKENPKNYFEVVYNHEFDSYKILIGDKTPDDNGYYAMLEGRDALYVLDTGVENAILLPRSAYITPTLSTAVDEAQKFSLKSFEMSKKGEPFIKIEQSTGKLTYGNNASHRLTFPAYNYSVSLTGFDNFLTLAIKLSGSSVLLWGDEVNEENLEALGFIDGEGRDISDYSFKLSFPASSEEMYVLDGEEYFTVYSKKKNLVATATKEAFAFLEWDMLEWISSEIFMLDVDDVESISFEAEGKKADFMLENENGVLKRVTSNGALVDLPAFRELYKSLMYILVVSPSDNKAPDKIQLKMTVRTRAGEELDYVFYYHSAISSYYTLNGFGEFYVSREKVEDVKNSAFALVK